MPPDAPAGAEPIAARALRRVRARLLPYLVLLYVVAFVDRVNVNFAALGMTRDLGFSPVGTGLAGGLFFIGYFLFEIPGTMMVERWSARRWIARIMISWGLVAVLMGAVQTRPQFYALRFILGAAEAGFFPGIIVYLTHWFPAADRAKAMGAFTVALPISNVLAAPLSGLLLGVHWWGLAGWRWLFIIEGLPAVLLGVTTLFVLTDHPRDARWLRSDERAWLVATLDAEAAARRAVVQHRLWRALADGRVWLLALAYFLVTTPSYGIQIWMPQIVKGAAVLSDGQTSLVVGAMYLLGLPSLLLFGWSSDRRRERRWHAATPILILGTGLVVTAALQGRWPLLLVGLVIAGAGLNAHLPAFWALPTTFLAGDAAAGAVGLINSVGNLGGFVGSYLMGHLKSGSPSFAPGLTVLGGFALGAVICLFVLRAPKR